jgi:hypothetical protein
MKHNQCHPCWLLALLLLQLSFMRILSFTPTCHSAISRNAPPSITSYWSSSELAAKSSKQAKKKKKSGGGGFGGGSSSGGANTTPPTTTTTISADKNSLETQWDQFASITNLEIKPMGDQDDEDYIDFEVADVFVRCTSNKNNPSDDDTPWFRIGKACTLPQSAPMEAALTLQKGLILWTAVHMRRELVAAGGKSGAASLQVGFVKPATLTMGWESDSPILDEENAISISTKGTTSLKDIPSISFGFRPDWNPPGFTYKRREKDAMKKKRSSLNAMKEVAGA